MKNDSSVQATNNSSIVSKRSVEVLYDSILYPDSYKSRSFFHHFVPKNKRRSPIINRGYLLRLLIIRNSLNKILKLSSEKVYVVNLGCGFDPLAFEYLENYPSNLVFVDIDYHALMDAKVAMIEQNEYLRKVIGFEKVNNDSIYRIQTPNYIAVQCDLNNVKSYEAVLTHLGLSTSSLERKVFIAEVSITYMDPKLADGVIQASTACENLDFFILEHLLKDPVNKFSKTMVQHFHNVNLPIKSVVYGYRTIPEQIARFNRLGKNGQFEIVTLMEYWDRYIDDSVKLAIDKIEGFDEYEEFNLFCMHYYLGHYTRSNTRLFAERRQPDLQPDFLVALPFEIAFQVPVKRRFAAACKHNESGVLINSGFSDTKTRESIILEEPQRSFELEPSHRLCHSMVNFGSKVILLGGRSKPGELLSDSWILDSGRWTQGPKLNHARSRANAFSDEKYVYVCNGTLESPTFERFDGQKWTEISVSPDYKPRYGAAVCFDKSTGVGYIAGGMTGLNTIDDGLYKFSLGEKTVSITKIASHSLVKRFGAQMALFKGEPYLFGGVSNQFVCDRSSSIVKISGSKIGLVNLSDEDWEDFPLLVSGNLVSFENGLAYVGGGAVCFAFGSYWNKTMVINRPKLTIPSNDETVGSSRTKPNDKPNDKPSVNKPEALVIVRSNPASDHSDLHLLSLKGLEPDLKSVFGPLFEVEVQTSKGLLKTPLESLVDSSFKGRYTAKVARGQLTYHFQAKKTTSLLISTGEDQVSIIPISGTIRVKLYPESQLALLDSSKDVFNENPRLSFNTNPNLTPYVAQLDKDQGLRVAKHWVYAVQALAPAIWEERP